MPWDMLGHRWAVDLLQAHVQQDRVRHAYLFAGPKGVGRRTLARRFAQALNCTEPPSPGVACGSCRDCRQFDQMQHPDLSLVQPEAGAMVVKVDQIRELQHRLHLAPYQARFRVALLLQFEKATASASNALLKTLEEPPSQVVLLLTAESGELLLPTIVSRCEVVRLRPLPVDEIRAGLQEQWGVEANEAVRLARLSQGRPGFARYLQSHPEFIEQLDAWLDAQIALLGSDRAARFAYAEKLYRDSDEARSTLEAWLVLWRDIFRKAAGAKVELSYQGRAAQIETLADQVGLDGARRALQALGRTLEMMDKNVNLRLALEVLMLDLPRI